MPNWRRHHRFGPVRSRSMRGPGSNVPTHLPLPTRNTMTGAQLLQLSWKERRTLRRKSVNTARYERRQIHAELLRQARKARTAARRRESED